jgi:hypothetical protein
LRVPPGSRVAQLVGPPGMRAAKGGPTPTGKQKRRPSPKGEPPQLGTESDQEADGLPDGASLGAWLGASLGSVVDGIGLTVGDVVVVLFVQPPTASAATRASRASSDFMACLLVLGGSPHPRSSGVRLAPLRRPGALHLRTERLNHARGTGRETYM